MTKSTAPRQNDGRRQAAAAESGGNRVLLFGIHTVEAALSNPARRVYALLATDNAQRRLSPAMAQRGITAQRASVRDLDRRLGPDTVHQGVLLETEALPEPTLEDLVAQPGPPLLVLDQVTDPHNVGAVLRSAAAFGAAGLVITRRHSPPLAGTLAKAASGALEHVPVALVQNLARALAELKALGVVAIGLDGSAEQALESMTRWPERSALVLGAEGKGLRQLTRETCTELRHIRTPGPLDSLNVSNAAAVALHWAALQLR